MKTGDKVRFKETINMNECDRGLVLEVKEKMDVLGEPCVRLSDRQGAYVEASLEVIEEPAIKDSGNRREFESGAVRDIQEGKGRCDLMPLDVVAGFFTCDSNPCKVLQHIYEFTNTGETIWLGRALDDFNEESYKNNRTMILEVSKHFEAGARKYGENNWQKGIPTHCYIDSAVRHYLKWLRGDKDEPHDRAFVWNLLCCIWTCKHKPELNDYGKVEE